MKKSILLTFVMAAVVTSTLLTGCGKDSVKGETCFEYIGTDTGYHKIFLGALPAPLDPIRDTLTVTKTGDKIYVKSAILNASLTGKADVSNCNKILLDSFISIDTIFIPSETFGQVKIWNVRAGGTGTVTATGVTTSLIVAKGRTNIGVLGLDNLDGKRLELSGKFLRLP